MDVVFIVFIEFVLGLEIYFFLPDFVYELGI